ncbi:MAG: hypothetical protein BroJett011_34030 [Chloroflexota bacterium]|nr:MAG: hypothetical protein BroJett011_34030 [Chloroflexota bacterium]
MNDQVRTIRVPYCMIKTVSKLVRTQRRLLKENGREPTPKEIALEMGQLSSKDIQAIKEALANHQRLDPDIERRWCREANRVERIIRMTQGPMSPETPAGLEESSMADSVSDDARFEPVDAALRQLKEQLLQGLDTLSERERKILELRFGRTDGESHTLEEVGNAFGVTRERIRQIEVKTLRKLSTSERSRKS